MDPILRCNVDFVLRAIRGTAALIDHEERCAGCYISPVSSFTIRRSKAGDIYAYVWVDASFHGLPPHWRCTGAPVFQRYTEQAFLLLRSHMTGEAYEGIWRGSLLRYAPVGDRPIFRSLDEVRAAVRAKETA